MVALPDRRYDETNWWRSRDGIKAFINSSLLLVRRCCFAEAKVTDHGPWDPDV